MPLKPTGRRSGRERGPRIPRIPRIPPCAPSLLAAALAVLLAAPAGAASLPEGRSGVIELRLDAAMDASALHLRPGGPYARQQIDLGVDARDAVLSGNLLLVAGGEDGLLVLQLETEGPPSPLAHLALAEPALTITARDGTAWLTGPLGLTAVDLSEPAAPRVRGRYTSRNRPLGFIAAAERGYLLLEHGLHVLDLSPAGDPIALERHAFGFEAAAFALGEDGLYIAAGDAGLLIYDPRAPGTGMRGFRGAPVLDVAIDAGRLYLANGADGITVLAQDPDGEPRWLGSLRGAGGEVTGLSVRDGRALLRTAAGRLYLADVENPQAMELLALLQAEGCCDAQRLADDGALVLAGA